MAEITAMRNNALPYPIYGQQFTITFPMLDADGDLVTGATTPDAERSLNGDTFADCTNESTEIATNSGVYYLTLTAAEMTADIVTVIAKSATAGMKTTVITLYPRKLVTIRAATAADDGSGTADIVLDSGASAVDDYYNGMVVAVIIDGAASAECRVITDYTGSTKTATVAVGFNTAVDNTDTFIIYLPEGAQHPSVYAEKIYSDTTIIYSDTTKIDTQTLDIQSETEVIQSQAVAIRAIVSDIQSDTNVMVPVISDIQSDTARILSDVSDVLSHLTAYDASAGLLSDINSGVNALQVTTTVAGELFELVSDIYSDTTAIHTQTTAIASDTTTLASDLAEADFSDIHSLVTKIYSDTTAIHTQTTAIASDTTTLASDLAEADFSDIHSLVTKVYSDTNAITTLVTKIDSDQTSQLAFISDIQSDTNVLINTVGTSTTGILSDINSGINALQAAGGALTATQDSMLTRVQSLAIVIEVDTDNIYSDTTHIHSDTAAIETKTASLNFGVTGKVDANITHVNEVEVDGSGTLGDEWGPV
jgi:hypothetical protein